MQCVVSSDAIRFLLVMAVFFLGVTVGAARERYSGYG